METRRFASLCLCALALLAGDVSAAPRPDEQALRSGDVVLQTSRSSQSQAIQIATQSPWSHVGIVDVADDGVYVIEAIQPVSRTPWSRWRARGVAGRVLALRPAGLDEAARRSVVESAKRFLGRPYDLRFGWGDARIYCSELVYKAFFRGAGVEVGERQRLDSLQLSGLKAELERRWGGPPPARLELVTPASIAGSPLLSRVELP